MFLALTNGSVALFPGRGKDAGACMLRVGRLTAPSADLLEAYREVVVVREDSPAAFEAAHEWTNRKWKGRVDER
jgi:hypothetical protein